MATLVVVAVFSSASSSEGQSAAPAMAYTGPGEGGVFQAIRETLLSFARQRGLGLRDLADASSDPEVKSAAPELAAAIDDYAAFHYAEAIERLDALVARLADAGAAGFSRREIADVFIYRAMSKTELGSSNEARDDLIRAATLFPTYQLDEARFRPSLRAAFERARASVLASPGADISITAEAGCVVHVDSERIAVGTAVALRPGLHYLRVRCAGFEPLATTATFDAGARELEPALTPLPDPRARSLEASAGATKLIWVNASRTNPGRVDIELIEVASKKPLRQWTVEVPDAGSTSVLEDVLTSLIDTEFAAPTPPPVIITREPPKAWYQRRWVWVAVGAAAATAVILPFALRDSSATGFGASIEGLP